MSCSLVSCRLVAALLVAVPASLALGACSPPPPEPEIASSAGEASYAQAYPQEVASVIESFGRAQVEIGQLSDGFPQYPGQYDAKAKKADVATALEQADRVGRSSAYHERMHDLEAARQFFEQERDPIAKKVAGSAQYVAKEAGCGAEVGSAAAGALDKVVKERLEERTRQANDAQRMVERRREQLGDKNAEALTKQIGEVSRASHLAYIEIVEHKVRLRAMIEEADAVRRTGDELIEQERAYQAEPGRTDKEKAASHERIEAMKKAQGSLDAAVETAKRTVQDMEDRIKRSQEQYSRALADLLTSLRGS